jgi:hypothetical protein
LKKGGRKSPKLRNHQVVSRSVKIWNVPGKKSCMLVFKSILFPSPIGKEKRRSLLSAISSISYHLSYYIRYLYGYGAPALSGVSIPVYIYLYSCCTPCIQLDLDLRPGLSLCAYLCTCATSLFNRDLNAQLYFL